MTPVVIWEAVIGENLRNPGKYLQDQEDINQEVEQNQKFDAEIDDCRDEGDQYLYWFQTSHVGKYRVEIRTKPPRALTVASVVKETQLNGALLMRMSAARRMAKAAIEVTSMHFVRILMGPGKKSRVAV